MNPLIPSKYFIPFGLLLLSAGILLKTFTKVPDFIPGFLVGLGGGALIIAVIKKWYVKQSHK
jgi:hypothetical protein